MESRRHLAALAIVLAVHTSIGTIDAADVSTPTGTAVPGAGTGVTPTPPTLGLATATATNVPGRLILRVAPGVTEALDVGVARGRSLGSVLGSPGLDALGRTHDLRAVRPLRRSDAMLASLAARRQAQTARRSVARSQRTARGRARFAPSPAPAAPDFTTVYVLELSPWSDMDRVAQDYAAQPGVVWAEPVRRVQAVLVPNDPYFASSGSWGQPFDDLWGLDRIEAAAAWDVARGAGTVVAVIDTGVDALHPDIQGNIWRNPGEVAGNLADDDGNGYVDDVAGWDFVTDDADPFDDHGHGTHVAGTVAATGGNGLGVVGVAFESRVMALKGLNAGGGGNSDELAEAILYAAENGADVINASWGGVGTSQLVDDAIEAAYLAGTVFVAAAGNASADVLALPFFPAANPRAIAVSALDHLDQRASFSNHGARIDVGAPGGGDAGNGYDPFRSILSLRSSGAGADMTGDGRLIVGTSYVRQAGTSMAAPHVAGAAALLLSAHPTYGPSQVRQALKATADDVGPGGVDADSGAGRIDVAAALAAAVLDVDLASPVPGTTVTGAAVVVTGTAAGDTFASYRIDFGPGAFPTAWTTIAGPVVTPVQDGALGVWNTDVVEDGAYTLRVVATNLAGEEFDARVQLTLDRQHVTSPLPSSITRLTGPIEVRGTAAGGGFTRFRIEWRITTPDFATGPWRHDGMILVGGGTTPIEAGVLATFTPPLTQNTDVDLRLVITRTGGQDVAEETRHVVLDPTLRAGWPRQIPGLPNLANRREPIQNVTIADVDANGTKEVLLGYGDRVWVFQHDGSILPGWPRVLDAGVSTTPFIRRSPAAADLDGDGMLEIVAAETEGQLFESRGATYIWHHDGTPMAGWPKVVNQAYNRHPDDPESGTPRGYFALTDVDGDGRRDIVAVVGPSLVVMDTQGNMLPGWPQRFPQPFPCILDDDACFEDIMAVGDVDGDGRKEIAIVTEDDRNSRPHILLLFDSTGHLMPGFPRKVASQRYGLPSFYPRLGRQGGVVNAPVMGDLDGDGDLEIVVMRESKGLMAFHHTGKKVSLPALKGTKSKKCRGGAMPPLIEPATLGDLDGDGIAEVLVAVHARSWRWKAKGPSTSVWICPSTVAGPDFLYAASARGHTPYTALRPEWPVAFDYPSGDNLYGLGSVAIGDVDGDLAPDVVAGTGICGLWNSEFGADGHRCFTLHALDRDGNPLPGFPKATPGHGPGEGTTPGLADLDGDGLKEIVFLDYRGNLMVWTVPGTPAPEAMQWPMFRHDPGHTGALVADP